MAEETVSTQAALVFEVPESVVIWSRNSAINDRTKMEPRCTQVAA